MSPNRTNIRLLGHIIMLTCLLGGMSVAGATPTPTATPQWILRVPNDFPTIQQALNHAPAHALILVNPGTYRENLVWPHVPDIRLAAASVPGSVTIDGGFVGRVVRFEDVPAPGAYLFGLRFTRGRSAEGGAGMRIDRADVLIQGCAVYDNIADETAGALIAPGIDSRDSNVTIIGSTVHDHFAVNSDAAGLVFQGAAARLNLTGCVFRDNLQIASDGAGAVAVVSGECVIRNCEFIGNAGIDGAAVHLAAPGLIESCLVLDSVYSAGGAAVALEHDEAVVRMCTISDNGCAGIRVAGFGLIAGSILTVNSIGIESLDGFCIMDHNDVHGNIVDYDGVSPGPSDISEDPLFAEGPRSAYYLSHLAAGQQQDSPCIDAGPAEWDIEGTTRTDHVADQGIPDCGWHCNTAIPTSIPTVTPTSATPSRTPTPTETPTPTGPPVTMTPVSGVIRVPEDFSSIQLAIDASSDGDVVLVNNGVFSGVGNRDIKFRGKQITVRSINGPGATVIDCEGTYTDMHRGFLFDQNEASTSIVEGIRIQNGFSVEGSGVLIRSGAYPVIRNCQFIHCDATSYGGAIRAYNSHFTLIGSEIRDCYASDGGGGVALFGGESLQPVIYRTTFIDNAAGMEQAGGVYLQDDSEPAITSCEFDTNAGIALVMDSGINSKITLGNTLFSHNCGGVYIKRGRAEIINCTFDANEEFAVRGDRGRKNIHILRSSLFGETVIDVTQADYSNTSASVVGTRNFDGDPLFLQGPLGEYYISYDIEENGISPNMNTGGVAVWTVNFEGPFGYPISLANLTTAVDETLDDRFADVGYHHHPSIEDPTPTPNPPGRPIIEDVLGSTEHFETSREMVFILSASVTHPEGADRIDAVELYLENFPTLIELYDDGTHGDGIAGDHRYNRELRIPAYGVPPQEYSMYVVAFDTYGQPSESAPYRLAVEGDDGAGPAILGRHVWYSMVRSGEENVGFIWLLAYAPNVGAEGRVELLYDGLPTNLELFDDGLHHDINAGDDIYGTFVLLDGSTISGPIELRFEVRAVNGSGVAGRPWPIAWKAQ